jgi:hypothetical protein
VTSRSLGLVSLAVSMLAATALARSPVPAPTVFDTTRSSDDWVDHVLHIQTRYARVLVVDASGRAPRRLAVRSLALNRRPSDDAGPERAYPVHAVYPTLQEAADAAQGGDLVAVMPGTYAGFVVGDKPSAGDGRFVHFKAMGRPGDVVIDRPSERNADWMIYLVGAHHVVVQGFDIAGNTGPGRSPTGPRAGIMMDGDFGRTGKLAHHLVITDNFSHNHRKWGFHSTDTHTVLIQNNLFALSCQEHSGYASDGSDDYVIRRNVFFGSNASGLQCNLDSVSCFHRLLRHPVFRDYPAETPTREWAMGIVRLATATFGENGFPDGRGVNFIIEDNVVNFNGRAGAGSLNLAGLQDSLIQNNLIYGNFNHGIAQWDDANPYDAAYVDPGPMTAEAVKGPQDLPLWGCHGNLVRNNTVVMANRDRAAMQCRNGSWGTTLRDNIFVNDDGASVEIFNTSIYRHDARSNVTGMVSYTGMPDDLKRLAVSLPDGDHNTNGLTRARLAREFVRYGDEPWVIIEGTWWRLNPARPDFRPRAGSKLLVGQGALADEPTRDLAGRVRRRAALGALAP